VSLKIIALLVGKDWYEFRRETTALTAGMLAVAALIRSGVGRPDFVSGVFVGVLLVTPYVYAQLCFGSKRQQWTLRFLPRYVSLLSMTLVTVNAPGLLLPYGRSLLYANSTALFLASVFTATIAVSRRPWAMQIPFWLAIVVAIPVRRLGSPALAIAALAVTPVIALAAAWYSKRQ
jgi:hypothetical protein